MDKKDLILDDGEIRRCSSNVVKMGYWRTLWEFFGYKKLLVSVAPEALQVLKKAAELALFAVIMPVLPFTHCYGEWSRAKKEVAYYGERRKKQESSNE